MLAAWAVASGINARVRAPAAAPPSGCTPGSVCRSCAGVGVWRLGPSGDADAALRELLTSSAPASATPAVRCPQRRCCAQRQSLWTGCASTSRRMRPRQRGGYSENPTLDSRLVCRRMAAPQAAQYLAGDRAAGKPSPPPTLSAFPRWTAACRACGKGWLIEIRHDTGALAGALSLIDAWTRWPTSRSSPALTHRVATGVALILCALTWRSMRSSCAARGDGAESVFTYLGVAASVAVHMGAVNLLDRWTPTAALAHNALCGAA